MNFDGFDDGYDGDSFGSYSANNLTGNQNEDVLIRYFFMMLKNGLCFPLPEALKHDTDFLLC